MSGTKNAQQLLSTSWEFIRPPVKNDEAGRSTDYDLSSQEISQRPPRYIEVQHGNIFLSSHPQISPTEKVPEGDLDKVENSSVPYQERISELEDAVCRLQKIVYQSQTGFSTAEKELLEQIENMKKTQMAKDKRTMQICWEHRALQEKFVRQERVLLSLQHENRSLQKRIVQYEHCLDDVSERVVHAIMAEDRLRAEFALLKNRMRDLEVKNTTSGSMGSPARGKDEGYCTMSSGPLPSTLENLPEEPEQWILSDGGHSADMEDWSLSQEELVAQLEEEDSNEWTWRNSQFAPLNMDAKCEEISTLLEEEIVYSESEELPCKDFTSDFYKLVNIQSESCKSLMLEDSDAAKIDSDSDAAEQCSSLSEMGQEQLCSCSSSDESTEMHFSAKLPSAQISKSLQEQKRQYAFPKQWRRSFGWRKVPIQTNESTNVEGE
ncbi:uncharacterized protein LOC129800678 isoform X3 [Phlebotomus papatasi]|uniref:uncharacterized protein LOC129800678 isoform X3 n=1 Tax=Phlebotomus papatasi TaxID=29031 RepID=UPI0024840039|nr:uncharacterized protein LOC129800678 isoform X3 [Phlebotomus papatasi]